MKKKPARSTPSPAPDRTIASYSPVLVFAVIAAIYLTTLLVLFPNLPVITVRAENMPNYVEIYPPFRMDEFNYYTIARNIISGDVYKEGSVERSFSAGSFVIPMDEYYQPDADGGILEAYGLMYYILNHKNADGEHDITVKVNKAREFLSHKDKVLLSVMFRGRELAHVEEGRRVIEQILGQLEDISKVESSPRQQGRRITCTLAPK